MNDRAVSILEQYDFVVERTWKGRGSILFETKEGIFILKEYKGTIISVSHDRKYINEVVNALYILTPDGLVKER